MTKNLCFHMGYASLDGNIYGSEISLLQLAKKLSRYYNVYIFSTNCRADKILDGGIFYSNSQTFEKFTEDKVVDVLIVSRYLNVFVDNTIKANKIYIWVHDQCFHAAANNQIMRDNGKHLYNNISHKVDGIIVLSEFHKQNMMTIYGIPENKIHVIGHGIDPIVHQIKKVKRRFIYTSCPTRGLDLLLKIFPKIHAEFNDVELYIYRKVSDEQLAEINKYPYIHSFGFQPNEKVREALLSSGVWLYPTPYIETFCMSALEAQLSGCFCITTNMGSLSEIVGNRGVLIGNCYYGSDQYIDNIMKTIRVFFESDLYDNKIVKARGWAASKSWDNMCATWLKLFGGNIEYKDLPSTPPITTFVINLETQEQKWTKCQSDLIYAGFSDICRVQAIDGETLVWGPELQKYFVLHEDSYKFIPHKNNAGIFGCGMSHVKLWEKLAELDDDTVWMIVEDDMVPNPDFAKNWTRVYNSIKDDKAWDMCYLGYTFFSQNILPSDKKINDDVYRLVKSDSRQNCGGLFCYVLRAGGAKRLLFLVKKHKMHRAVDWFVIDFYDQICAYICWPLLVHHHNIDKTMIQGAQKTIPGIKRDRAVFFPFAEKIVYINLAHRTDRNEHILKNLDMIDKDKILRFDATLDSNGAIGCYKSHIGVLELAIKNQWKNYVVFEDDMLWKDFSTRYPILEKLVEKPYDVIMLGASQCEIEKDTGRLLKGFGTHGYIVAQHYYETLLANTKEGLKKPSEDYKQYAMDVYWSNLRERDNWYTVSPPLCIQGKNYSDIEGKLVDYTYLYEIPPKIVERRYFGFADKVVYINLESRGDRKEEIEKELHTVIPGEKIIRFSAIEHKMGNAGCTMSHIKVLEMAIENKWKNCVVFEDDMMWSNFDEGYKVLETLVSKPYDVIAFGTHTRASILDKSTYKMTKGCCTHAYIVSSNYYETLLNNYKEGLEKLLSNPESYSMYNLDMYTDSIKSRDTWFAIYPALCVQRASFSDTEKRFTDYTELYK